MYLGIPQGRRGGWGRRHLVRLVTLCFLERRPLGRCCPDTARGVPTVNRIS